MEKTENEIGTAFQGEFSFLDQNDFQNRYVSGPLNNNIRFYINGIRCGKCIRKLEDLAITTAGIKNVRVEFGKSIAHVEVDTATLSFSRVAESIKKLGFVPIPIAKLGDEALLQKSEDRKDIIRLAVAGICAGHIMTYSFSNYFGVTGSLYTAFNWLSFILYLPVVSYVAWPFYLGAITSFRQRRISIDLPMAVASLFGFIFSTVQLLRGRDFYFDSLSGFLFLILASRWLQKHLQRHFLNTNEDIESLQLGRVRLENKNGWSWIPLAQLNKGDSFLLHQGEIVPVEAELASEKGYFGMAWLTGELMAKLFLKGSVIPAGAKLSAGPVHFKMKSPLSETQFGKILEDVQKFSLTKNRIVTEADTWAQWLLVSVFGIAIIFLISYWSVSSEEAIRRALALIIVACPCAMAFGTPLAMTSALKKAKRKGLIIRNANVFEKANFINTIFFDKTGTLTDSDLTLNADSQNIPDYYKRIILSLENESQHPIAFSLRKAFQLCSEGLFEVQDFIEKYGTGVSGTIDGKYYELKNSHLSESKITCYLFENHHPLFKLTFTVHLKPHCLGILNNLRAKGFRVCLVSGDKKDVVQKLATHLNFSTADTYYELGPEEKADLIAQNPQSMMVGDGVNDSLAMMKAEVSIAASGGMQAALKSSDVYLTEPSLRGVEDFFKISKQCVSLIHQNLIISVAYNLLVGSLALFGLVNPFVAAVLMPISSGFILLSTWMRGQNK